MTAQPKVFLRALEEGDLERTHRWHNDPDLYRTLVGEFRFVSEQVERDWLAERVRSSRAEANFAICLLPGKAHIGNIYLRPINLTSRNAVLGMFIGERRYQGRGLGRQALAAVLRHAFDDLGLHRIYFEVLADNETAIRLYERAGFKTEGRLRSHVFKDGQFKDVLVMGMLAEEYQRDPS